MRVREKDGDVRRKSSAMLAAIAPELLAYSVTGSSTGGRERERERGPYVSKREGAPERPV